MTLSVAVYDADDLTTPVVSLDETFDRMYELKVNDVGAGSFSVLMSHDELAELTFGRVFFISDSTTSQDVGFVLEAQERRVLQVDGASQETVKVSGRTLAALLEGSYIRPEGGANAGQKQTVRVFNWANPAFDDSGWGSPAGYIVQGTNPNASSQYAPPYQPELLPRNWPDATAEWVLGAGTYSDAPDGFWYLRWKFSIATAGNHRLSFAVDNDARVYLDGVEVFDGGAAYKETYSVDVSLPVGDHVVAARIVNFPKVGTNPTSFLGSLATIDDGEIGTVVHRTTSASDIEVLTTPTTTGAEGTRFDTTTPGMTVGEVLDLVLTECQDDDELDGWTWDFTSSADSDSVSWPSTPEITLKVGDPPLTVLRQLTEAYIDWSVDLDDKVLHVYIKGTLASASGVSYTAGTSVSLLEVDGEG